MSNQASLPAPLLRPEVDVLPVSFLGSPEWCEEHKEYLSLFCLDDLKPLCKHCAPDSHEGHRVYLLTEAAIDCKEELKTLLNRLTVKMNLFKQFIQTCQHSSKFNQTETRLTEELMKKEFEKFHQFLRQEEAARLLALRMEKEEKISKAEERIAKMNQVIKSLEEKIQLIEGELDAGGDGTEFLQHYQDTMSSTWINHMMPQKLCRPLIDVAKHLGNLLYAVWEKIKHIAPYTPVTLDPRTAGQSLRVSPELNRVQITSGPLLESEKDIDEIFPVPANPERFHHSSCILTKEGFTTGEHSWDIEVGNINNWTLGVAAQSVPRRGEFEVCPEAGLWCISLQDGQYRALTSPTKILNFDNSHHLSKVHVRLDCDGGMLEFRNADTGVLIFTFTHCFAEIVYPYFESIYVGGSLAVLAQEVNISLGSDYNSLEGTAIILEDQEMKSQSPSENNIVTDSNSTIKIDVGHLIEDKEAKAICPIRENTTKPSEKVNTLNNTTAIRKHTRKTRYNIAYHVSLNRALNNINNKCATMNMATINKA